MLKIYDEFLEDEAINALRDRSYRVHVSALIYCSRNLTDGQVSDKALKVLQAILEFPVKRHVSELVEAGLWVIEGDGHRIKNYLEFNPDADTVKKEKAQGRERMRKLREKRARDAERSGAPAGERDGARDGAAPVQSSPVPSFERPLKAVPADQEIEHEIDKILRHVKGADDDSRGVLVAIARKLPVGCVAKVRESCQSRSVSVGYAVNALKSELADLEEVA